MNEFFTLTISLVLVTFGINQSTGQDQDVNDSSLLELLPNVDTSSFPECKGTLSCFAARLRPSALQLETITVVGKTFTRALKLGEDAWEYKDSMGEPAVLYWSGDDRMFGHITTGSNIFTIVPVAGGMLLLKEEDTSLWNEDEDDDIIDEDDGDDKDYNLKKKLYELSSMRDNMDKHLRDKGLEDQTTIAHITITVYMSKKFKEETDNYTGWIKYAVELTNDGYVDSDVKMWMDIHCIVPTPLDIDPPTERRDALDQFTEKGSEWNKFNELRKSADTAILMVSDSELGGCGVNWGNVINKGKTLGVVAKSCIFKFTFGHEVAHGLGIHHDRRAVLEKNRREERSYLFSGSTKYSFGNVFVPGIFRSIMAYNPPGAHTIRVNRYSSPNIYWFRHPTGTRTENNALVLNENRFAAAAIGDESERCPTDMW